MTVDTEECYYVNQHVDIEDPRWKEFLPAYYADLANGLNTEALKITVEITDKEAAYEIAANFPTGDI
jgi:hypothetical protein